MDRLKDKVSLITGGAQGIGKETARAFVAEGAKVVITDLNARTGEEAARELGGGTVFLRHDVTSDDDWGRVVADVAGRFGRLDVLVNNAGVLGSGAQTPETTTQEEWRKIATVNVEGVMLGCKHAIEAMRANDPKGGSIINLSSIAGIWGTPMLYAYGASKGSVRQLTKSVAAWCGNRGYGIRCNSVHPGLIETTMGDSVFEWTSDNPEEARKSRISMIPLGRLGQPRDIAYAVLYLASDEASYVTGTELLVDGGILTQ
jgi:3(or 17)beta-hydroxysteroid dehydrogenase